MCGGYITNQINNGVGKSLKPPLPGYTIWEGGRAPKKGRLGLEFEVGVDIWVVDANGGKTRISGSGGATVYCPRYPSACARRLWAAGGVFVSGISSGTRAN